MDHVSRLWSEIQLNTWQELRQALELRRGNPNGMPDELVEQIIVMVEEFETASRPFPETPNQLYEYLNQILHQV